MFSSTNRHNKQKAEQDSAARRFANDAQAALDSATLPAPKIDAEETSYRSGLFLSELKPGQCGDVSRLVAATQGRLRLLEMGLTPGTHVKVLRIAAFGGPVEVLVRGYQLSLRREEAAAVWLAGND